MSIKIGIMADNQGSDQADNPNWRLDPASQWEYRRYTTAATRLQAAVDTFNAQEIDLVVDPGDLIDRNVSIEERYNYLRDRVTQYSDLTMPWIGTPGNHENSLYITGQDVDDYYTEVDIVHAVRSNVHTDSEDWKSYTYDIGGIRFICVKNNITGVEAGVLTWLEDQLAASTLPVIVICHVPLWPIWQYGWSYASDYAAFQTKINAADNVQAVLCGHYHWNHGDVVVQDVPYYSFWGSVLCPNVDDNAYFIVEVIPNAVYTTNGLKANIKITGYGSNGTSKTTDFKQYLIA